MTSFAWGPWEGEEDLKKREKRIVFSDVYSAFNSFGSCLLRPCPRPWRCRSRGLRDRSFRLLPLLHPLRSRSRLQNKNIRCKEEKMLPAKV